MESSNIRLIFPYFFILIFISALISQKCIKKWAKFFFSDLHENFHIIWLWYGEFKQTYFPKFFHLHLHFYLVGWKMSSKNWSNFLSQILMKNARKTNLDMESSKIKLIFPYCSILIFIFALISQKCLKKWVEFFFLDLHENFQVS